MSVSTKLMNPLLIGIKGNMLWFTKCLNNKWFELFLVRIDLFRPLNMRVTFWKLLSRSPIIILKPYHSGDIFLCFVMCAKLRHIYFNFWINCFVYVMLLISLNITNWCKLSHCSHFKRFVCVYLYLGLHCIQPSLCYWIISWGTNESEKFPFNIWREMQNK